MNTELVNLYTQKIKAHIQQGKQYFVVCEAEYTNKEGSQIMDDLIKDNSLLEKYDVRLVATHKNNSITSDPKSMSKTLLEVKGESKKVLILIENYELLDYDIREIILNRLKDENNEFIFVIHTHYLAQQSRELVNVVENARHKYERFNISAQCHESIIEKARNKYNARDFYDRYLLIK